MAATLRELGVEPPAVEDAPAERPASATVGADGFRCKRCGGAERLPDPPMRGELGRRVHEAICRSCWQEWIAMGTKVINELGLDLRSEQAQDTYDMHMKEFLGLED
jgi:Fe-S cluster biosynthesis and repair protein YggX